MHRPIFFIFILTTLGCQQNYQLRQAKQIAEEVRQAFAPDKRVALFRIDTIMVGQPLVVRGETNLPEAKAQFFEKMTAAGIAFTDSLLLLPAADLEGKDLGVVNVSVCNMRSEPKHSAELATQALLGATLRVWKRQGDFFLVQSPDDYFGWVDDGGFSSMDSVEYQKWVVSAKAICLHDYVFAYAMPDENAPKVSDLLAGNMVQVIENQGVFTKIAFPDGRTGFVKTNHLMPLGIWLDSRQPDAAHLLASAGEMMGRPYLWGGTSGKGVDCSGFTKMAFFLNGLQLPRDASQQVHIGETVETDTTLANLQPGDLLFFGRKATPEKKEKITHVAIYLGDGSIIHASDRVKVESLRRGAPDFNENRLKSLVRCKRVIGQEGRNGVLRVADSPFYNPMGEMKD
ncbi:MAG: C40 family peptidase [Bacteroidetes bacterium]|nr:C40 family peptidase [Bacteroidota bacterium]